jgi:trans-2,3-dihydro-3-hydroxyanthranilate isomerase
MTTSSPKRRFDTLDVFTDQKLAGNPLAVVHNAEGLTTDEMQSIAREFNLAETVFVLAPTDPVNTAKIRIFTPRRELPFAGHPTIGTAINIAQLRAASMLSSGVVIALEEDIGLIRVDVRKSGAKAAHAHFELPRLPELLPLRPDANLVASALGLSGDELGFEGHVVRRASAGVPFTTIPVASVEALGRATPQIGATFDLAFTAGENTAPFLYTRAAANEWRVRMFAPHWGVAEDPATGAAVAAFAAVLASFERLGNGTHQHILHQGIEMGRPSKIILDLTLENGALTSAAIGGSAVPISEGTLL